MSRGLPALAVAACVAVVASFSLFRADAAEIIHTEPSTFSPIVVYEESGERCIAFGSLRAVGRQTCIDLQAPDEMVFGYTRMMMSALFIKPDPQRVLIVGLGGGTLSRALGKVLPDAVIDTVEIDPAIVKVAETYFGYRQTSSQRVFLGDGRAFIEKVHRDGGRYDLILLDAFDVDYIPPHLLTREFLQHVRAILSDDGVLAANTFSESRKYHEESVTYASVFGPLFNLRHGNRVILATRSGTLPDAAELRANAAALAPALARFGIDVDAELERFSRKPDWDTGARVLTD